MNKGFAGPNGHSFVLPSYPCFVILALAASLSCTPRIGLSAPSHGETATRAYSLKVAKRGIGSGIVVSRLPGIDCGADCSQNYRAGTKVELAAAPATGSVFVGWSGACNGTGICRVRMTLARSVKATFVPGQSLLEGAKPFTGPGRLLTSVTYPTKDGDTLTQDGVYAGLIVLFVDPATPESTVLAAVQTNGGTVAAAIPLVGQYIVRVPAGSEGAFLSAMFIEPWTEDGGPVGRIALARIESLDGNPNSPEECTKLHGSGTEKIAGRRGHLVIMRDIVELLKPKTPNAWDALTSEFIQRMERADRADERLVFNISLQYPPPGPGLDRTRCMDAVCRAYRKSQFLFLRLFLNELEREFLTHQSVADNTIVVLAAGNWGVDLDKELGAFKNLFPNAFRRVKIVGGTNIVGDEIESTFNHLDDNTTGNMVYARGVKVDTGLSNGTRRLLCTGTSFAAPEVTSVLATIWASNRTRTSAEVLVAFDKALHELGMNNILPQNRIGRTTQQFIDRAIDLLTPTFLLPPTFVSDPWAVDLGTVTDSRVGCQYHVTASGVLTLVVSENADGTVGGTAAATMDVNLVVTHTPPATTCTPIPFNTDAAGNVTGNDANLTSAMSNANGRTTLTYTGVRTGDTITGSAVVNQTLRDGGGVNYPTTGNTGTFVSRRQ